MKFLYTILFSLLFSPSMGQSLEQGLIAKYCFDGDAFDIAGNKSGVLMNGATATTDRHGNTSGAITLDGIDDFVQLPSDVWLTGDFTFSGWVKLRSNGFWPHLWGFGNGTNKQNIFFSTSIGTTGTSHLSAHDCGTGASYDRVITTTSFPLNAWTHIAVTLAGNQVTIYKDNTVWQTGSIQYTPCSAVKDSAFIGKSNFTFNNNANTDGEIDDFRFYNRVLSAQGIDSLYKLEADLCWPESVSAQAAALNNIQIVPNPFSTGFVISNNDGITAEQIAIYDVMGQRVQFNKSGNYITLPQAARGIYIMVLTLKDNLSKTYKLEQR